MDNYRKIEKMKCSNCIHADVCAVKKCAVNLQPVYTLGCCCRQKLPEFAVAISKEEYEIFLRMKNIFDLYSKEEVDYKITQSRKQAVKDFAKILKKSFELDSAILFFTSSIENKIDKIAKEMGVNIKE